MKSMFKTVTGLAKKIDKLHLHKFKGSGKFPFTSLPPEIRLRIYDYLIRPRYRPLYRLSKKLNSIDLNIRNNGFHSACANLMLSCRLVYIELAPLVYRSITLKVPIYEGTSNMEITRWALWAPALFKENVASVVLTRGDNLHLNMFDLVYIPSHVEVACSHLCIFVQNIQALEIHLTDIDWSLWKCPLKKIAVGWEKLKTICVVAPKLQRIDMEERNMWRAKIMTERAFKGLNALSIEFDDEWTFYTEQGVYELPRLSGYS